MNEAFLRTQMLLGADALDKLSRCHVIVFGLGGVGSYAAECLARSGVGELTLVDQDTLSLTNINRQLYAGSTRPRRQPAAVWTSTPTCGYTPSAPPTTPPTATISSPPATTTSWTPLIWSAASWI